MTARQLSKLSVLLNRVRGATAARGKKAELARFLGEPPQRVHDWLKEKDNRAPGGEVTLLMLEWVQAEEANQPKTVAVLLTPQRRKTRKPNPHLYENSSRIRKRK